MALTYDEFVNIVYYENGPPAASYSFPMRLGQIIIDKNTGIHYHLTNNSNPNALVFSQVTVSVVAAQGVAL